MSEMVKLDGLYWPRSDTMARPIILSEVGPALSWVMPHVPERRCVVQAGGNVGVYPLRLAKLFERVYTAEPDPENFDCLERNVEDVLNIDPWYAAFGDGKGECTTVHVEPGNCGAHRIVSGTEGALIITIDSLEVAPDLIWLDVEGYEWFALRGAEETIRLHRPLIVTEEKGLGELYGAPDAAIGEYLSDFGYQCVSAHGNDRLYKVIR